MTFFCHESAQNKCSDLFYAAPFQGQHFLLSQKRLQIYCSGARLLVKCTTVILATVNVDIKQKKLYLQKSFQTVNVEIYSGPMLATVSALREGIEDKAAWFPHFSLLPFVLATYAHDLIAVFPDSKKLENILSFLDVQYN